MEPWQCAQKSWLFKGGGSSFSTTLRPKNGTEPLWVLFFFSIEAAVVYVRDEAKRENQNFRIN